MIHVFTKVPSKLSTIMVAFDGGARAEWDTYSPGIAHMLEHMIFKGTSKRSYLDISRDIAFLGGDTNAFTSNEKVVYYITVPYENVEAAVEIISDMVFNSTLSEEEFLKEREVVMEEALASNDNVSSFMWKNFIKEFYDNRFCIPIIGEQENIEGFSIEELRTFYEKIYTPERCIVSLCGNHTDDWASALLEKYFGSADGVLKHDVDIFEPNYADSRVVNIYRPELEHTHVWMCFPALNINENREACTDIMLSIFGQGMDSRLFSEVREKHGLCYSIGSSAIMFRDYSTVLISASTRGENVEEMLSIVDKEIEKLKTELVSEEELQRARNKYRADFYALMESSNAMAKEVLSRIYFDLISLEELEEQVSLVTAEDIMKMANLVFDQSKRLTLLCSSEGS